MKFRGHLHKMFVEASSPVSYRLVLGGQQVNLNEWLGKQIRMEFLQEIACIHCGRITRKSFSQGYCYPCFSNLAQCDLCIMSPEKCHFHLGTCRQPDWGMSHCMQPHIIYLSNTSGVKIGITRETQLPTRWIDQGAIQAISILRVSKRYHAGLIEQAFRQYVSDRTNWRKMLKHEVEAIDLFQVFQSVWPQVKAQLAPELVADAEEIASVDEVVNLDYPALNFPVKVSSINLDKQPLVEGRLDAIKGQYLLLDNGVINIRKYGGYLVRLGPDFLVNAD